MAISYIVGTLKVRPCVADGRLSTMVMTLKSSFDMRYKHDRHELVAVNLQDLLFLLCIDFLTSIKLFFYIVHEVYL